MNFASLLKLHENRQPNNQFGNQYLINCNRKTDVPLVYGTNNYNGIKKKTIEPIEPINQKLAEIYQNFQENSHVQWILQLQAPRIKIHKFKPSKISKKKEELQTHQKPQPRFQLQQKKPLTTHQPDPQQEDNNHIAQPQDFNRQIEHHVIQPDLFNNRQKKNYSPMKQVRPKKFNKEDNNWMDNLNQNKFSFGEDAQIVAEHQEEMHQQNQQQNQENQSCIEEKEDYEVPEDQIHEDQESHDAHGVDLMMEYEKYADNTQQNEQRTDETDQKMVINQTANGESGQRNHGMKIIVSKPCSGVEFNADIGFSFDEIDKIGQNYPTQKPSTEQPQVMIQIKEAKSFNDDIPQEDSLRQLQNENEQQQVAEIIPEPRKNSLVNVLSSEKQQPSSFNRKVEIKPVSMQQQNLITKQKQSDPSRFYFKANVRNLTPEKLKYPRVESKLQSNLQAKPYSSEIQINSARTQTNTRTTSQIKVQNVQNQKQVTVPSSDRLLALINESKRLLQSRTVGENKSQDRIKRIVIHQQPVDSKIAITQPLKPVEDQNIRKTDSKQQGLNSNSLQNQKKVPILSQTRSKPQTNTFIQQKETNAPEMRSTPQKNEVNFTTVSSPKSPLQQKAKFYNQLANMETSYTPEKRNLSPYSRHTQNTTNPSNMQLKQPYQPVTQFNNQPYSTVNKTNEGVQQTNYFQQNYAYRPLSAVQPKPVEQKDNSVYKPQPYQSNIQPYQPMTQVYQATGQVSQQLNDPSANIRNVQSPQVYPYTSGAPSVKTYSPYFPVNNTTVQKTVSNIQTAQTTTQVKTNQVYQTYTYSGFTSTQNQAIRPLTANDNNFIKINSNYVSPFEKYESKNGQKDPYQLNSNNPEWRQKENLKPVGLGIEGVRCVESKIYEAKTMTNVQSDPKEASIEFSLRIQEHFLPGSK